MRDEITANHFVDENDNPAGGSTYGQGFAIAWQNGPLVADGERKEPNGAFVEDIIVAALDRIEFYQGSRLQCDENARACLALRSALDHLDERTRNREARGVEGTHGV